MQKGGPSSAFLFRQFFTRLHVRIIGAITTLWGRPVDVLAWVFDIACFAVHTVLEIDDKLGVFVRFLNKFIHTR